MPLTDFDYPDDRPGEAGPAEARLRGARAATEALVRYAVDSRTIQTAGRRVVVLGWLLGAVPAPNQKELAAILQCTPAAACKLIADARRFLRSGAIASREG